MPRHQGPLAKGTHSAQLIPILLLHLTPRFPAMAKAVPEALVASLKAPQDHTEIAMRLPIPLRPLLYLVDHQKGTA